MTICILEKIPETTKNCGTTNGDRSWLVITRNTITHEILKVELVRDYLEKQSNGK